MVYSHFPVLSIADYGYLMENGRIVMAGVKEVLLNNVDIREFYLKENINIADTGTPAKCPAVRIRRK